MGLSGSGKSTLIRLLNRLIEPTSGNIYIDGENISTMGKESLRSVRRNKMSMVFQNFGLFPIEHYFKTPNMALRFEVFQRRTASKS